MAFSEAIRQKVRRAAAFRCCRCNEIGIDAHHIIPAAEGGPNTFANAAPLCQNCHDRFGDNPKKRKEITQMRDFWYEVVAEKWPTPDKAEEKLNDALLGKQQDAIEEALLERVQALEDKMEGDPSPQTMKEVATGLVSATKLGDGVYANVQCHNCGSSTGLSIGATECPNCGTPYP
jgi:hypothetical protein